MCDNLCLWVQLFWSVCSSCLLKKMLSFLASSTFFKYAQNAGFAFKKFKIFMGGHAPKPP